VAFLLLGIHFSTAAGSLKEKKGDDKQRICFWIKSVYFAAKALFHLEYKFKCADQVKAET
jgi:hypothetical protein